MGGGVGKISVIWPLKTQIKDQQKQKEKEKRKNQKRGWRGGVHKSRERRGGKSRNYTSPSNLHSICNLFQTLKSDNDPFKLYNIFNLPPSISIFY
jgi:hypothetical protein